MARLALLRGDAWGDDPRALREPDEVGIVGLRAMPLALLSSLGLLGSEPASAACLASFVGLASGRHSSVFLRRPLADPDDAMQRMSLWTECGESKNSLSPTPAAPEALDIDLLPLRLFVGGGALSPVDFPEAQDILSG
eukprot:CAMPEP_0115129900 /NCGR_PEP_ID=MMETSP0227-20121206/52101_1 /TAXON_ID=89957 /ORGANISM="Polarella glacialis, Strain CCMP 1383" /LENGTH=137 /DNA_ID=CAMNT_0002534927 /DNA_START=20 /DNA_END=431 /DNA_ORIENTATION=-